MLNNENIQPNALISFIIPAHNAANTLRRCVDSIATDNRLMQGIEVFIVENGSSDKTLSIAESLSKQYTSVKVLHSEKGVSNARNLGIEHATGKWIAFVDADDEIIQGESYTLYEDAKNIDTDLILYGHKSGKDIHSVCNRGPSVLYDFNEVAKARVLMIENPTRYMQVWAKLFKREIILAHNIRFHSELRLSEDSDFTLRYSKFCQTIEFSEKIVYQYMLNTNSAMRAFDGSKARDYATAMEITTKAVHDESEEIKKAFDKYILMHLNILSVREVFNPNNPDCYSEKISRERAIIELPVFRDAIRRTKISECKSLRMISILLLKLKLYRLASFVFLTRATINQRKEV